MTAPRKRTQRRSAATTSALDDAATVALIDALDTASLLNECLHLDGVACGAVSAIARDACDVCHLFGNIPARSLCAGPDACPAAPTRGCDNCALVPAVSVCPGIDSCAVAGIPSRLTADADRCARCVNVAS